MESEKIKIRTEYIKLDQLLKFAGIAESGADAKDMILDEMVFVNGELPYSTGQVLHVDGGYMDVRSI